MVKIKTGKVKRLFGTVHLIWSSLFDTALEIHQDTRPPKGYGITIGWVFIGFVTFNKPLASIKCTVCKKPMRDMNEAYAFGDACSQKCEDKIISEMLKEEPTLPETCDCDRSVIHDCVCPQCKERYLSHADASK